MYGSGYNSGEMRIAFSFGNADLRKKLFGGVIFGSSDKARLHLMKSTQSEQDFTDDFHLYTLKWEPGSLLTYSYSCKINF